MAAWNSFGWTPKLTHHCAAVVYFAFTSLKECYDVCCNGGRCLPSTRCCRGELDSLAENTELLSAGTAEKPKQSKGRRIAQPLDTEGEPDKNVSTLSSTVQSVPSCSPIYMTKTALFGSVSSFRACSIKASLFFLFFSDNKSAGVMQTLSTWDNGALFYPVI